MHEQPDPVLQLIGATPLVELARWAPAGVRILAKLEGQNPSGSIKDRVAAALIDAGEQQGRFAPGDTLVEASSGNTAIALAMVARRRGYTLHVVMPRSTAPCIIDVLRFYGVPPVFCERCDDMRSAVDLAESLAGSRGWKPVRQFTEPANVRAHYEGTGAELVAALSEVDVFVAGIGTGGTVMGVGRRLRERFPQVRVIGVEPRLGDHLQGLRSLEDGFRPPLLDLAALDGRRLVGAAESMMTAEEVARVEGLNVGVSGGACLFAARKEAERLGTGTYVAMCSDAAWKYLPARPWDAARAEDPRLDEIHWW